MTTLTTTFTEKGVPFQPNMVRALLREVDPKLQTRRLAKFVADPGLNLSFTGLAAHRFGEAWHLTSRGAGGCWQERSAPLRSPYGLEGDRIWVREAWRTGALSDSLAPRDMLPGATPIYYLADGEPDRLVGAGRYRPGMFMPRWASRITLEITEVRVERLQDISEADAIAEGIEKRGRGWHCYTEATAGVCFGRAVNSYHSLWTSINGPGSWDANPFVWAVSFRKLP